MPKAVTGRTTVLHRTAANKPTIDPAPTTSVMATSVGEKWPVTIRAQPTRNSQMKIMIVSQKMRQGNAAHFASSFP